MNLTLRVAVMLGNGCPREYLADRLGITHAEVRRAIRQIELVADRLGHTNGGD